MQLPAIQDSLTNGVVMIGVFDGFHCGHRQLLEKAIELAADKPLVLVTFTPNPKLFWKKDAVPNLLYAEQTRTNYLGSLPVDGVLNLEFNQQLAAKSATQFVEEFLVRQLRAKHVVVGENFRFGSRQQGDVQLLQQLGDKYDFQVTALPLVSCGKLACSSTQIKQLISNGDVRTAARILGRRWMVTGTVHYGRQANPQVPTVNIRLHDCVAPKPGVYAGYITVASESQPLPAAIYIGHSAEPRTLEAHILDRHLDLYHQEVALHFLSYVRADRTFTDKQSLNQQITADLLTIKQLAANCLINLSLS